MKRRTLAVYAAYAVALLSTTARTVAATAATAAATATGGGTNGTCTTVVPSTVIGGDLYIKRIITGLWQTSGGWGPSVTNALAVKALQATLSPEKGGYFTLDGADHYGPAEDLMGSLRNVTAGGELVTMTKWCPSPGRISRAMADAAVQKSLRRMQVKTLDVMQIHWWDYTLEAEMMECMRHIDDIRKEGIINKLSLTNFDTRRLEMFLDAGLPIASNQVQFSLIDTRPLQKMAPLCIERGVKLLTYGTLMGGLLTDTYLGKLEPRGKLPSPSLSKYYNMLKVWGSWPLFQELLVVLRGVADRQQLRIQSPDGISIANVAVKWVLDQPSVAAVIVGLRAGLSEHSQENLRAFDVELSAQDVREIRAVLAKGNDLMARIGDCGDEYR